MICHKVHIFNLCSLHKQCRYGSANYLLSSQDLHLWSLSPSWPVKTCFFKYGAVWNVLPQEAHLWPLYPWLCFFKWPDLENMYHKIHIYNLCGLHEWCEYVSLRFKPQKMIYHKIHSCNRCGLGIFQMTCSSEWFSTIFTFMIFVACWK